MSDILPSIVYQLGVGGIGGFLVGYAIKKISKLIVVLIGLFILFLIYLGTSGIIDINYEKLVEALTGLFIFAGQATAWLISLLSLLPFMGALLSVLHLALNVDSEMVKCVILDNPLATLIPTLSRRLKLEKVLKRGIQRTIL